MKIKDQRTPEKFPIALISQGQTFLLNDICFFKTNEAGTVVSLDDGELYNIYDVENNYLFPEGGDTLAEVVQAELVLFK